MWWNEGDTTGHLNRMQLTKPCPGEMRQVCTAGRQLVEGREEASSLTGIPFVHLLALENFYRQQDDQFPTMLKTTSQATDYVASASLSPGLAMA